MLSRRTAMILATTYSHRFHTGSAIYDFLFVRDYNTVFCEEMQYEVDARDYDGLRRFIMGLKGMQHTSRMFLNLPYSQQEKAHDKLLLKLAEDVINETADVQAKVFPATNQVYAVDADLISYANGIPFQKISELLHSLEDDGYLFKNRRLIQDEAGVLDADEEIGILQVLYKELGLGEAETAIYFLNLSTEHYVSSHWEDSILNTRKFLEKTTEQVARKWMAHSNTLISEKELASPVKVRIYLQSEDVVSEQECKMLEYLYWLLSNTGSHPRMAEKDQARLLRNMGLTYTQFVMLRLKDKLGV